MTFNPSTSNSVGRFTPRPQAQPAFNARPFTWSYSKLKNYESCPQKHLRVDLLKEFEEAPSAQLEEGNAFHAAMAKAVSTGAPIDARFKDFQKWVDKLTLVSNPYQIVNVELKLAITRDFKPCGYFDKNVWFRGVIDYLKFAPYKEYQVGLAADYKTGKMLDDPVQLALFAQLAFSHYPTTLKVRTEYMWTQDDCTTREDFTPADMTGLWTVLLPRVQALEESYNSGQYPLKPSGLCKKHCPVVTCAHNGRKA